jgi:GrpB-like predicted nucleotidyltransferase (UPF0157 family)
MIGKGSEVLARVNIVDYDPRWPTLFERELSRIASHSKTRFIGFEHIGSTAILGQRAKPIIDMMASVEDLTNADGIEHQLCMIGYTLVVTGMRERLLFRREADAVVQAYQLHVVTQHSWEGRKERMMRDYLRTHPEAITRYGDLND